VLAGAIVLVALCNVPLPYGGDQSLFALGARHILAGDALYRDFWDLKQPAIFWFFSAARLLFGTGPVAVHVLEALWFAALATTLYVAAARLFEPPWMRVVLPLLGAVYMQVVLTTESATQVESLAPLPLFVALWLAVEALRGTKNAKMLWFGAGVAAGIAVCFKLFFAIVVAAMWLAVVWAARRRGTAPAGVSAPAAALWISAGVAIPLIAAMLSLRSHDAISIALTTWFVTPGEIVKELPHQRLSVLAASARGFVLTFLPLLALAPFAIPAMKRGNLLAWGAAGWLAAGTGTILLQVTSWWSYQWFLIALPAGLLATLGLEEILRRDTARTARAALLLGVVLAAYPLVRAHTKYVALAEHRFATNVASREGFQEQMQPPIARARLAAHDLGNVGPRGVYVFGNPILYEVLGTLQPIAVNGWLPELLTRRMRRELLNEMCTTRPRIIYVDDIARNDVALVWGRSPDFVTFLRDNYRERRGPSGSMYVAGPPRPCPRSTENGQHR
jgi:hypothetical protein